MEGNGVKRCDGVEQRQQRADERRREGMWARNEQRDTHL